MEWRGTAEGVWIWLPGRRGRGGGKGRGGIRRNGWWRVGMGRSKEMRWFT